MQAQTNVDHRKVEIQLGDSALELQVPLDKAQAEAASQVIFSKSRSRRISEQDLPLLARVMTLSNDLRDHGSRHKTPWVRLRQRHFDAACCACLTNSKQACET